MVLKKKFRYGQSVFEGKIHATIPPGKTPRDMGYGVSPEFDWAADEMTYLVNVHGVILHLRGADFV